MKKLRGIKLYDQDFQVLKSLEEQLGEELDFCNFIEDPKDSSAFFAENGYITLLGIHNLDCEEFPTEILKLKDLKVLSLQITVKTVPKEVFNLPSIKKLFFDWIEFDSFPEGIKENNRLEALSISNSHLKVISERIMNFQSLKILSLNNNHIEKLPTSIEKLINLEELYLKDNPLIEVPVSIGNLHRLEAIILTNTKLKNLPDTIGNLKSLKFLYLELCKLSYLPDTIGNLSLLRHLRLSDNNLFNLPDTIGNLHSLEELSLKDNPSLSSLPESILKLKLLKSLSLWGTKISNDNEILKVLRKKGVNIFL